VVSSKSGHFDLAVKCVQRAADTPLRTPMLSLRKNSSGGTVGLDIDGRYLAAAQVESGRVVRGVSAELPEGLVADGEVVNRDGLTEALKNFVAEAGLPKTVRLGVANQQIVVRVVELPRIEDEKQRDAAVRFQAAEAIAMPLDEAVLDHQIAGFTEAPDGSPRMQVVLVAARRSMVEALLAAAKDAGLKPEGVDLDAFALVRTLAARADDESGDSACVYCHLGGVSNLAIAVGSACFFTRPLSAVWDDEDAAARLADEIRLSIDYYMTQAQAKPVGAVVLSGPGSADEQLIESLGVHLGLPTTVAAPLGVLDRSALDASEDPHRLTVAAGLAMGRAA
jgi:type IV pilus assembly protein PilM